MFARDESDRLERLWRGTFGDAYVRRNLTADEGRKSFWWETLAKLDVVSALEVGCNVGANLRWLAEMLDRTNMVGVDINQRALEILRERLPGVRTVAASARSLPFADGSFDLVFTTGVLIHQDHDSLNRVMDEIVRCSSRYVLCGEYCAEPPEEIPYHGERGVLFKRDFGSLYQERFPELTLLEQGFLPASAGGWEDVTFWIFAKR